MSTIVPSMLNDIYNKLLEERIVFITGEVRSEKMQDAIAKLLYLELQDSEKDITLYIDSPGGCVISGLALIDTMNFIKPDVATLVTGMAASMGSIIATSGAKGKRKMLTHSEHMIHQVSSGARGQLSDMKIRVNHAEQSMDRLVKLYASATGKDEDTLRADMDRDNWMTAEKSLEYGLIDEIVEKK